MSFFWLQQKELALETWQPLMFNCDLLILEEMPLFLADVKIDALRAFVVIIIIIRYIALSKSQALLEVLFCFIVF